MTSQFFQGKAPALDLAATVNPKIREEHCSGLLDTLHSTATSFRHLLSSLSLEAAAEHLIQFGHDQLNFGTDPAPSADKAVYDSDELERLSNSVKELTHSYSGLCPHEVKGSLLSGLHPSTNAGPALLSFLALVTPSSKLAQSIHSDPSTYLEKMTSTFSHSAFPSSEHSVTTELIEGAPGTVSPVKATLGYQQDGEGELVMVWRMEVEMLDNWYQGTVDVKTGRVVGAVDWARDAPSPKKPCTCIRFLCRPCIGLTWTCSYSDSFFFFFFFFSRQALHCKLQRLASRRQRPSLGQAINPQVARR